MNYARRPLIIALALGALVFLPFAASALEFRTGERTFLNSGDRFKSDVYIASGEVQSDSELQNDLTVAGGKVRVDGPVWIDLLAAGGEVVITGDVGDDARVAGGRIEISGLVRGDLLVGGGEFTLSGKGVGGDAAIAGGRVQIDAPIAGEARIAGGEVVINSTIGGNVRVTAEKLTLGPKAALGGDLTYSAAKELTATEGAVVAGATKYTQHSYALDAKDFSAIFTVWMLAKLLMILVGALALFFFFPRLASEIAKIAGEKAMPSLGIGLAFLVAVPIVSLIMLVTLIGMPIGLFMLLMYFAAIVFPCIAAPIVVGGYLHRWISGKGYVVSWQTVLYGVLLYFTLTLVPIAGPLLKFIAFVITLGAVLSIKWSIVKGWR